MHASETLPGTPQQQEVLQTITDYYAADERVLSVLLFGSMSLGNWDPYSDLDLDVVLADDTSIDARVELKNLCAVIRQKHGYEAIIIADLEEGDVVLGNLVEFSIRYHVLNDTKPAILDTMHSLTGSLALDEIRAAANYAYETEPKEIEEIINEYLRYALALHHAIQRQRLWMALEMLHRLRAGLLEMYGISRGAFRPIHYFDAQASRGHHELVAALVPQANLNSAAEAFRAAIRLLEDRLDDFSGGAYRLTTNQQHILAQLKQLPLYRTLPALHA